MQQALRLIVLALVLAPGPAWAQAYRCAVPGTLPSARPVNPSPRDPKRLMPVTGYTLALSWSPEYCRANADDPADRFQCGDGNRFGFILHGLWPEGQGGSWPQYCRAAPLLGERTLRRNLCAIPSAQLMQREWARHGSCTAVSGERYLARATQLFGQMRYPDMDALSRRKALTVGQFSAAFAAANRGLSPAMIRVTINRKGWLDEVRVCLDLRQKVRACPPNSGGARIASPISIWRGRG